VTPDLDVREPPPGIARRVRSSRVAAIAAVLAISVATVVGLDRFVFNDPTFIERVSIENASGYDIQVAVAGEDSGSMPLGVALQHCVTTFHLVIDQGDVWRIAFRTQGRDGGDVLVDRASLERDAWRYGIPDFVVTKLQAAGAPLPPLQSCPQTQ